MLEASVSSGLLINYIVPLLNEPKIVVILSVHDVEYVLRRRHSNNQDIYRKKKRITLITTVL